MSEHLPASLIVTGGRDNKVIVHRDGKPPQALEGHKNTVHGLSFCPTNPDLLASASWDQTVVMWDLNANSKIKTLQCPAALTSVSWSCGGQHIAAASADKNCYVFDAGNDYEQLCVLEGHTDRVWSVAFHPHNPALCATASWDKTVRVWQLSSAGSQRPECVKVLKHGDDVNSCCWLPDGKHLVSGGGDFDVRLWNVEDGTEVAKFEGHSDSVYPVAASPDCRMIASGSWDNTCRIWEAKSGGEQLQVLKHPALVHCAAFTSDGLHVVTCCSDGNARVWGIAVGKVAAELGGLQGLVCCLAVPPISCQAGAIAAASSSAGQQERRRRNDDEQEC